MRAGQPAYPPEHEVPLPARQRGNGLGELVHAEKGEFHLEKLFEQFGDGIGVGHGDNPRNLS